MSALVTGARKNVLHRRMWRMFRGWVQRKRFYLGLRGSADVYFCWRVKRKSFLSLVSFVRRFVSFRRSRTPFLLLKYADKDRPVTKLNVFQEREDGVVFEQKIRFWFGSLDAGDANVEGSCSLAEKATEAWRTAKKGAVDAHLGYLFSETPAACEKQ